MIQRLTLFRYLLAVFALTCTVIGAAGVGIAATGGTTAWPHAAAQPRLCFPLDKWNTGTVAARYRPCVRVVRLYEDGSFKYAVSDADGTIRYSGGVGAEDR